MDNQTISDKPLLMSSGSFLGKTRAREFFSSINSLWFCVLVSICLSGCSSLPDAGLEARRQVVLLEKQLAELNPEVGAADAAHLAQAAVQESINLAHEYRVVRPAWFHNVLVNHGLRERGLCFEWTNDLFVKLYELHCVSLELHLAVARMDTRREHNSIVVTARGQAFENGVVLDAWRHSGRLWSGPVLADKYPWGPLPPDRINPDIQALLARGTTQVTARLKN